MSNFWWVFLLTGKKPEGAKLGVRIGALLLCVPGLILVVWGIGAPGPLFGIGAASLALPAFVVGTALALISLAFAFYWK